MWALALTENLIGSQTQKGVTSYAISPNRQKPLAGTFHAAIFNTFRRTRHQVLYWAPAMVIAYFTMEWAIEK
jgi:ubiquinol-cytochrome c reductase subunit 8